MMRLLDSERISKVYYGKLLKIEVAMIVKEIDRIVVSWVRCVHVSNASGILSNFLMVTDSPSAERKCPDFSKTATGQINVCYS